MPRRVQDIVPGDRRSIRDVPVGKEISPKAAHRPSAERTESKKESDAPTFKEREIPMHKQNKRGVDTEPPLRRISVTPPPPKPRRKRRKTWLIAALGVVVVVAGAAYAASTYFARATFTIMPKVLPVSVNGTYIAQNPPVAGTLTYELATLRGTASNNVPAASGPQVSTKAQGKVTLYNSYSSQAQRLIAGTRLANDSGKIYRLTSSIVIPGYSQNGGAISAGTVSAAIQADLPGDSYNISRSDSPSDFKIVAYKDTAKYDSIFGRIASDVSGGFVGTKKTVSPALLASTTARLKAELTASLAAQAKAAVPPGYIMYDKAYVTSFSAPSTVSAGTDSAKVTIQGTIYGILFKRSDLIARIAGPQAISSFGTFDYSAPGLETLTFSIANPTDFSPEKKSVLITRLKGDLKLVGTVPVEELKHKFAGATLAQTQDILKPYAAVVESGSGELIPSWTRVPTDLSRIIIKVEKP